MGRKVWDRCELKQGYRFYVGGKEIELDAPISASQLPSITGTEIGTDDSDIDGTIRHEVLSAVAQDLCSRKENIPRPTVHQPPPKAFVSPVSFYGQPPTKKSGPLYAI